ncbi:hypothetical protein P9112_008792 [Eukaryota sp. TZLM1-RC]
MSLYDTSSPAGKGSPSYSIKGRHSLKQSQISSVGPGAYSPDASALKPRSSAYSLRSRSPSASHFKKSTPGVGSYNLGSDFQQKKGYSVTGRNYPISKSSVSADPGTYTPSTRAVSPQSPAYSLGAKPKSQSSTSSYSGDIINLREVSTDTGRSYTIAPKTSLSTTHQGPAPDAYSPNSSATLPSSPAYSMSTRATPKPSSTSSPGTLYSPSINFTASSPPSYSIKGRSSSPKTSGEVTPGPQYDVSVQGVRSRAPAYSLTSKKPLINEKQASQTPGPGNYSIKSDFEGKCKGSTLKGRRTFNVIDCSPGPSAYNPQSKCQSKSPPAYSFGSKSQRKSFDSSPAPGTYTPKSSFSDTTTPSYSICGKGGVRGRNEKKVEVGPGSYTIPSTIGNCSAVSMKSRPKSFYR